MTGNDFMQTLARYRLHFSFFVFVALVLEWQLNDGGRPHPLSSLTDLEHPLGIGLVALGLWLRSWAAGVIDKRKALATAGPYALVRHPLYLGSFLIALGLVEIMEDRLALAVAALLTLALYVPTIRREECFLAERFGDVWRAYAASTPAFLPRAGARFAQGEWRGRRWWHNREWRVVVRTVIVIALLEWWNGVTRGG